VRFFSSLLSKNGLQRIAGSGPIGLGENSARGQGEGVGRRQARRQPNAPSGKHGRRSSSVDLRHVTRYTLFMSKTFADKRTKDLSDTGRAKRFPPNMAGRAARKLE